MAQELSIYQALQREVVRQYYAIPSAQLDTHVFSDFFIEATGVLAGYGDQNQQSNATLCARSILSRSTSERQVILETYEFPGRVHMQMAMPSEWPDFPAVNPIIPEEPEEPVDPA